MNLGQGNKNDLWDRAHGILEYTVPVMDNENQVVGDQVLKNDSLVKDELYHETPPNQWRN